MASIRSAMVLRPTSSKRTIQRLLGHQSLDTTTPSLQITRQPLATIRSPFDLLPCGDPAPPTPESPHATAYCHLPRRASRAYARRAIVGSRRSLPPVRRGSRRHHTVPPIPQQGMHAIEAGRTAQRGGHAAYCPSCGLERYAYHACRHRHGPTCQTDLPLGGF